MSASPAPPFTLLYCFLFALLLFPTTLPTIPPLSSCHLTTPPNLLLQLCLPATFIFPFPCFHIAFLPLLYSLCRLSLPLLYTVLFHFTFFLPDWHFSSSDPHPISLNLFLVCCLHFPSALFSSIYFSPFFSAHPPLFSLKPYLLPFSVAGYKTLPQPPSACLCMKADMVIDVLTLWWPLGPWHFQHPLSFFSYV